MIIRLHRKFSTPSMTFLRPEAIPVAAVVVARHLVADGRACAKKICTTRQKNPNVHYVRFCRVKTSYSLYLRKKYLSRYYLVVLRGAEPLAYLLYCLYVYTRMESLGRHTVDDANGAISGPGTVSCFVQFVNQTVGKHFKCCICLRYVTH